MGGLNKGLQKLHGKGLAEHVHQTLSAQVTQVKINANQDLESYAKLGCIVIADSVTSYAGPLAGIHAGLMQCETDFMLTAPCDSPFLPHNLFQTLATALNQTQADIAVALTIEDGERQIHPVFSLLSRSLEKSLFEFLNQGGRKPRLWYQAHHVVEVLFEDNAAFRNINTLAELERCE